MLQQGPEPDLWHTLQVTVHAYSGPGAMFPVLVLSREDRQCCACA